MKHLALDSHRVPFEEDNLRTDVALELLGLLQLGHTFADQVAVRTSVQHAYEPLESRQEHDGETFPACP